MKKFQHNFAILHMSSRENEFLTTTTNWLRRNNVRKLLLQPSQVDHEINSYQIIWLRVDCQDHSLKSHEAYELGILSLRAATTDLFIEISPVTTPTPHFEALSISSLLRGKLANKRYDSDA